ncbi:hypothetical protein D8M04_12925 [Oceanobacillus piezotolerans]|uniref:Uncharacterized protein n=1 Tax=Oceanobacillus piezotolerans TaxID=2448030 RepID=A0A498DA51_9BACI|nr:hypothetical protein [Oceanobacillus piezotolerans]RLL43810.1 hypothetical protein D8M04_12925 [Oceanobacillus piezotolerans]
MRGLNENSLWFVCSITLNALGNSFMIVANLGSAPWATAGENLVHILPFSVGVCIIILNFFSFVLSYFMKVKFTLAMIIKSMALTIVFGLLIDLFIYIHQHTYVPGEMTIRYIYLIIGLNLIAVALCIYFQSSTVYLPADYLLKAFGKLMNNYTTGTILCTAIPLSISLVIILYRNDVTGLGPGTFLFMAGIGFLIDQYNRWIVIPRTSTQNMHST